MYVYIFGTSTCKSFIIAVLFPVRMRSATTAAMKTPAPRSGTKNNSNKKFTKRVKIGVVCWFCFVSAVRKQRLELLSARAERDIERERAQTRSSSARESQTRSTNKRRMKMTSLLAQHWRTRPKLGLEELF